MVAETKTRRIRSGDWEKLQAHIMNERDSRAKSQFRQRAERIWREIDRQLALEPMKRVSETGAAIGQSWHNAFELGELSKALEIIADDVMRIMFPQDRYWFDGHSVINWPLDDQTGQPVYDEDEQEKTDNLLRSFMLQQHADFGFRERFRILVTEILSHGCAVAEARWEQQPMVWDGEKVRYVSAPVFQPYSIWNAYPDPSPAVIGTNLFYTGSMILEEFMPMWRLRKIANGEGWMPGQLKKVPKSSNTNKDVETSDVKLTKWYGDLVIERSDGDMYFPNSKAICANGVIVYMSPNELPYPSVIYAGYQRQDVRDPYYTSPIIKQSPMQKVATIMANKFADAVALKVEPPIEYDGNDPDYVMSDGPVVAPGAKTPTRSVGKGMKALDIGDPSYALNALELALRQLQEGTGVSAIRSGVPSSDRQTAFEVAKTGQGAEVRTVAFVSILEMTALRPWLYMQHELNRKRLSEYWFYSDDMMTKDVVRVERSDLPDAVMFDVVGARGLLGEEERTQKVTQVTAFASQNPLFAPLLKAQDILLDAYRDAGKKNPEKFVKVGDEAGPDAQAQAQIEQIVQQAQEAIAQAQDEARKAEEQMQAEKEAHQQTKIALMERETDIDIMKMKMDAEKQKYDLELEKIALGADRKLLEIQKSIVSDESENDFEKQ